MLIQTCPRQPYAAIHFGDMEGTRFLSLVNSDVCLFFSPQYCQESRVLSLYLRNLADPQTENVIHPLKCLKDTENLRYLLCTWLLHGSHDVNEVASYFSGCLCANDFVDDSTRPFYFYSMQKLIIEAIS